MYTKAFENKPRANLAGHLCSCLDWWFATTSVLMSRWRVTNSYDSFDSAH